MFQSTTQKIQETLANKGLIIVILCVIVITWVAKCFMMQPFRGSQIEIPKITVSGSGEMNVSPDTAKFTATISKDAKTMAEAQKKASEQGNALIEKLIAVGISEKDIKTEGFNAYPKYENRAEIAMPCSMNYCPPVNSNPVIVGYTVSHTYSIKVRDLDKASDIAKLITDANISSVSGPEFVVDDSVAVKNEARDKAIADAKAQAKILAQQLGVRLGKIVDFQVVDGGNYPMPMYDARMVSAGSAEKTMSPDIMPGETTIKTQVMITYQIR